MGNPFLLLTLVRWEPTEVSDSSLTGLLVFGLGPRGVSIMDFFGSFASLSSDPPRRLPLKQELARMDLGKVTDGGPE
jgi:hypothetical protein